MRAIQLVPAGVVLLALGAIGGAAQHDHSTSVASTAAVTQRSTVTSATRACPPALDGGTGTIALIAGPAGPASQTAPVGQAGSTNSGQAELTSLPPAGVPLRPVSAITQTDPGVLALLPVPAAASTAKKSSTTATGWSVTASGTMAQAMEAEVAQTSGLAALRCGEPGSDIWFAGPGEQNGAGQIQLDLMNVDSLAATVTVNMITDAGPVQAGDETGITVPPHQTVTENLSSAAGNSSVVAIEVRTSSGRVAADVAEGGAHGSLTSWLPSAAAPSTQVVIPGVPSGHSADLYLAVPGTSDAKVSVLAITPQGDSHPFGTQAIDLPGQSATAMALSSLGTAAALQITANVPVTATVGVPGSGVSAFTTTIGPVIEQAVVAGNTGSSGYAASVVLSAPGPAARVRLTEISAGQGTGSGATASQVVSVQAGHTLDVPVTVPPAAKHDSAFALVITPVSGSGPVYAARVETHGQSTVVSIIPAASALTSISLPPVRYSYDAISP